MSSNKRKRDDYESVTFNSEAKQQSKKFKSHQELMIDNLTSNYDALIDAFNTGSNDNDRMNIEDKVQFALDYICKSFPSRLFENMPCIVHLHQIYAIVPSRTQVDREIERLRDLNLIYFFKFDSASREETLICLADSYKYVLYKQKHTKLLLSCHLQSIFF